MIDSKPNRSSKFPAIPWRMHLLVGGVGLIVIGIVIYGFYIGERLNTLDETRQLRYLHMALIGTSVLLFGLISLAFHFFVRRGKKDYQDLKVAKQKLEMENAERVRAETELKNAHQELEERVSRRTAELSQSNEKLKAEVAERSRVEELLQHHKSMLQEVFDGIPDSLILIDRHMDLKMINKSAAVYYKVEKLEDVIGRRCYQVAGETDSCRGCRIRDAVTRGCELSFERKGFMNPERIEQVSIYPIEGIADKSGDAIIRVIDITDNRLFERQLIQSEKMASLGIMVSSVAHEINNPNNFITFNIPILKDYIEELIPIVDRFAADCPDLEFCNMPYPEFREDIYKLMDNIKNGAARISSFVTNLREFSQSDADRLKTYVDFKSVVEKVIAICGKKLDRSIKSLEMNIPRDLPQIYTAPHAIEQVLLNLLMNAAQAADKRDSRVTLNISTSSTPREHLILEIIDNGCGIEERSKTRLFDPFYTTRMHGGGTGLGLYVCHNLIKDLEGRIEVESEPGAGSKFTIILPNLDTEEKPV